MRLYIDNFLNGDFLLQLEIDNNDYWLDRDITYHLNIEFEEYEIILKKYNAHLTFGYGQYGFKNKEDAEKAIEELEPYLILATLTGE